MSKGPYTSLNLGANTDDDIQLVRENRFRALRALLAGPEHDLQHGSDDSGQSCELDGRTRELLGRLVCPRQVHGSKVCLVSSAEPDELDRVRAEVAQGCDAIVCGTAGVPVLLCYADCVPVVLVRDGAFAVIHSGWKGTYARISALALQALCRECSCTPQDVSAYIGPHIGATDYEVSSELAESFVREFGGTVVGEGPKLDLAAAIRLSLCECGMDEAKIVDCGVSTLQNMENYYSYRGQHGICGRHGAIALLDG